MMEGHHFTLIIVFAMMIDDSHALTTFSLSFSLFLLLVLSRRTTRGDRLRTGYIFKNQIGPETSNSRTVNHDNYRTTVAKDAAKALRIKLLSRQPREQFLALTALECLMKNCGPDFHEMMLSKGLLETCMELGSNTTTNPNRER